MLRIENFNLYEKKKKKFKLYIKENIWEKGLYTSTNENIRYFLIKRLPRKKNVT